MPQVKITNLKILQRISNSEYNTAPYFYMLFNNDEEDGSNKKLFFAFDNKVRKGWEILIDHWDKIQEIEFDYFEQEKDGRIVNRVVNILDYTLNP